MYKKTEIEMERDRIIKTYRTLLRLKHSFNADKEINDLLPDRLSEFDAAIQSGELKVIPHSLLDDILES